MHVRVKLNCVLRVLFSVVAVLFKYIGQGRTKQLNRNLPTLFSQLLAMCYVLFLYETRTLLEVFNCAPIVPDDGQTYLQVRDTDTT